ncbi:transcription termination/antitermination protein NusA [Candidatus Peregrinibacteria bacterium]|nr:transcription termination/antitermination protein NusA [Candidatus Peregrinibacteria bacterium]
MQTHFLAAINQICDEKNIQKDSVMETIKAALKTAYRKDFGNKDQEVEVDIDEKSGLATVYQVFTVVKKVEEENIEISLEEARKYDKKAEIEDTIRIDVTPAEYGRIAAQSAKQVIIQRIQEAERDMMYDIFKDRENEMINAVVHRVDGKDVYVNLDNKITAALPMQEQIRSEKYYSGQRIKLYLDKVVKTTKGPQLLISRTHPSLVKKLLELEIPEVKSGVVAIKSIARDPGVRCKIAVISSDEKIDPIGSCVGQKGVRVQNVMDELNGERLDIIEWSEDIEKYIKAALAPANTAKLVLDDKNKHVKVYVDGDQRPLAIGKNGQNVRLASILTGWEIDILDVNDLDGKIVPKEEKTEEEKQTETVELLNLPEEVAQKLQDANLTLVEQLKGLSENDLSQVEGIDEDAAKQIVAAMKNL